MSFQAYLDNIEEKTGLAPRQFLRLAADFGLGRGHGMALVHVITKGPKIASKHVDSGTAHSDPTDELWLDGRASNPKP
ncbi:DUF4287 domain-containing protein [Pseudolysinimonas yzui]|uniref:DUF4287 domain-containing protein n=1 Tax=Pseudolysinimonas yzui TaxID=2708254 RepID=A0A8J3GSD2_9MICO|nr:DUF4287 domain-containing protein [Pseudolysinimonas yzui]GHF25279.1 hypothetical protein GCM10011600_27960 [Pseudolysinimonas yzui]